MKCPHPIEPHQIQGLDFIHMYPVVQVDINIQTVTKDLYWIQFHISFTFQNYRYMFIVQWLVKKALETRGEREAANRAYSLRWSKKLELLVKVLQEYHKF